MTTKDALTHIVAALLVRHAAIDQDDHAVALKDLLVEAAAILQGIELSAKAWDGAK